MKKYFKWAKLLAKWNEFDLADKFLLIIMVILMIQTAHNLFSHELTMQDSATLDVVIRTTTAAIFGYFISANFHSGNKNSSKDNHKSINAVATQSSFSIGPLSKAELDLNTDLEAEELHSGYAPGVAVVESEPGDKKQIVIVASIGIICLILLLIARNYSALSPASVATLSQLRDFISGSVGFLIGQSTNSKKSS